MTPQNLYAMTCLVGTLIQATAAGIFIYDRVKPSEATMASTKGRALALAILLSASTAVGGFLCHWIWTFNPPPTLIEKATDKPIPCVPSQSGAASTKGQQSPAMSGSGNSVNYGQTPPPPK
jgi:hypothetical protein